MITEGDNAQFLESAQEDFDQFLAAKDWKNAQAIVDNLFDTGFEHEATILRKAYLQAQYESTLETCPLGICDGSGICPGVTLEDSDRACPCTL